MQLGEFGLEPCSQAESERSPCHALDLRDSVDDTSCFHWQCRSDGRGCEWRPKDSDDDGHVDATVCRTHFPGADDCDDQDSRRYSRFAERADGVDNDCNDVIDEDALAHRFDDVEELDADLDALAEGASLQLVRTETESLGLASLTQRGRAVLVDPVAGRMTPIELDSAAAMLQSSGKACPTRDGIKSCNARELALAASPPFVLSAAISDNAGCSDGEIRLGVGNLSDEPLRLWLGGADAEQPNELQYGADVSEDVRCPVLGVVHPSIASLQQGLETQGLSLWLGDSVDAQRACDAPQRAVDVHALGLWVVQNERPYLRATELGTSRVVGRTHGSAAPALIASDERGVYIAGYGNAEGELEILQFDALPPQTAARKQEAPWRAPDVHRVAVAQPVDHVALAISADGWGVGAAFRMGCRGDASVWFNGFTLRREPSELAVQSQLELSAHDQSEVVGGPVIVHVAKGFQAPSASRAVRGGWLVSWLSHSDEGNKLWAVRISEDWKPIDHLPFEVTTAALDQLIAYPDGEDRVSYLAVNQNTAALTRGTTLCRDASR